MLDDHQFDMRRSGLEVAVRAARQAKEVAREKEWVLSIQPEVDGRHLRAVSTNRVKLKLAVNVVECIRQIKLYNTPDILVNGHAHIQSE